MGWKIDKERTHWLIFKPELERFWHDLKTFNWKELHHSYVNLFVEKNRWFPYTTGHIEAFIFPVKLFVIGYLIYLWIF